MLRRSRLGLKNGCLIKKTCNWLENEMDTEFEEDHFQQTSVSNDSRIHRKLHADAPPFHPLHEKNEAKKIDKKAGKIGLMEAAETCVYSNILW